MNALMAGHDRETLADVWDDIVRRSSRRVLVACSVVGGAGLVALTVVDSFRIVALLAVVVGALGVEGLARQGVASTSPERRPALDLLVPAMRGIAIVAAIIAGLLLLGAIFGGSIEVMRR